MKMDEMDLTRLTEMDTTHYNQTQNGFTIIEILIVLVLFGILSTTAVYKYIDFTENANAVFCKHHRGIVVSTYLMDECAEILLGTTRTNEDRFAAALSDSGFSDIREICKSNGVIAKWYTDEGKMLHLACSIHGGDADEANLMAYQANWEGYLGKYVDQETKIYLNDHASASDDVQKYIADLVHNNKGYLLNDFISKSSATVIPKEYVKKILQFSETNTFKDGWINSHPLYWRSYVVSDKNNNTYSISYASESSAVYNTERQDGSERKGYIVNIDGKTYARTSGASKTFYANENHTKKMTSEELANYLVNGLKYILISN